MLRTFSPLDASGEARVAQVIDCGFAVHRAVGPGFTELIYRNAMCLELTERGIPFECEKILTVTYRERPVGIFRPDLIVCECVVVEIKALKTLEPVHDAQLIAYLKASKIRVGFLMNFGCATFKEGLKRIVL